MARRIVAGIMHAMNTSASPGLDINHPGGSAVPPLVMIALLSTFQIVSGMVGRQRLTESLGEPMSHGEKMFPS